MCRKISRFMQGFRWEPFPPKSPNWYSPIRLPRVSGTTKVHLFFNDGHFILNFINFHTLQMMGKGFIIVAIGGIENWIKYLLVSLVFLTYA
jgi:hypothetical protein